MFFSIELFFIKSTACIFLVINFGLGEECGKIKNMGKEIKIIINGRKIKAKQGQTVLETALENGIEIPALCFHSDLKVKGNCRLCVVEINRVCQDNPEQKPCIETACSTKVEPGMQITTESPALRKLRTINLELLFSQHKEECTDCVWNSNCQLLSLARKYKLEITRFSDRKEKLPVYDFGPSPNEDSGGKPALLFDSSKCIDCRHCVEVCEKQDVCYLELAEKEHFHTVLPSKTRKCIFCGQCIMHCPSGAFEGIGEFEDIEEPLQNKNKVVVFQIAPAIRTSIGEEFKLKPGSIMLGQLAAGLRKLGVNKIFDTSVGADFTTFEEAEESLKRMAKGENLPMFSSCCPAWVRFIEVYYPSLIPHFSTARSPQVILGGLIKTYWAKKEKIAPENIIVVSVMPCVAKKYEISRKELKVDGLPPIDYVLTTRELAHLFRKHKIDLPNLKPEPFDAPFGEPSGAGVIYGASGGVMESALRTAYAKMEKGKKPKIEFGPVRGQEGLKTAQFKMCGRKVKVAVANGLDNALKIIQGLDKEFKDYACIEVMACPGGCIGGGGQPVPADKKSRQERAKPLYEIDKKSKVRVPTENPLVKRVYKDFLTNKMIIKKICHTHYSLKDEQSSKRTH